MASIYSSTSKGWKLRLDWAITGQSITNNRSTISLDLWVYDGSGYSENQNEKQAYYILQGEKRWNPYNYSTTGWYKLGSKSITVNHNADGTGSVTLTAEWDCGFASDYTPRHLSLSKTVTLTTIPRASAVSAPSTGTLGTALKITIDRKSQSFSDKIYYKIGGNSAVQLTGYNGTAETYSWTPPVSLATNAPNSTKLVVTIFTNTYNGSTYVGRSECSVTLTIPASEVPSLSVAVSDPTNVKTNYGGYFVQLRSKIKVTITGTGIQGSTIKSYNIKVGRTQGTGTIYTANAKTGTTDFLQFAGSAWVTCTVTDSRGRTATKSIEYTVKPYRVPTISSISATRCTQNGAANRTGEYGKVTFTAAITALSNKNKAAYKVQYREYGAETWTTAATPAAGNYNPKDISTIFPADTNKRYTVRVVATDAFSTSNSSMRDISASFVLQHLAKSKSSVGIGRLCDDDKTKALQVGLDAYFDKSIYADRFVYMGGYKKSDTEKSIYFQTTDGAANPHNVGVYGGNGESTAAWGVYDAQNSRSVIRYDDVAGTLTLLGQGLGPAGVTVRASGSNLKSFSAKALHSAMLGIGFLRLSGETNASLAANTTYDIATIGEHIPTATYALSVYCNKNLYARLTTSGIIQIRPKESIAAGYYIYIAGIWIAS